MPYRLSALAERDLEETWSYVAEDASAATADRLIDAMIDCFELLAEQPRMGRLRPEFGADVRSFAVENHVIYYRHNGDILIARVLHGRRDQAWTEMGGVCPTIWRRARSHTLGIAHRRTGRASRRLRDTHVRLSSTTVSRTATCRRPDRAPDPVCAACLQRAIGQRSGPRLMRAKRCPPISCRDRCRRQEPLHSHITAPGAWSGAVRRLGSGLAGTISGTIEGTSTARKSRSRLYLAFSPR